MILVDTHIYVWARLRSAVLTPAERRLFNELSVCFVSIVSLWEVSTLIRLGRLEEGEDLLRLPEGFSLLPLTTAHCLAYQRLPLLHRDPFDRMLIAQAGTEGLPFLTRDTAMAAYADQGLLTLA